MKRLPCLVGRLWAASPSCQYVMNQTSSTSVWPSIRHPHHQFYTMCRFPINLLVWQLQSNHCVIITKRWLRITPWPGLPIKKRPLLLNQLPEIDWAPNIGVMCSHLKDFEITLLKFWLQGQRHLDGLSFSTWVFGLSARRVFSQEKFDNWFCQRRKVFTSVLAAIPSRVQCLQTLVTLMRPLLFGQLQLLWSVWPTSTNQTQKLSFSFFGHSMPASSTDQTQKSSFTFFWSHNQETFFYPGQLLR